MEIYSSFENMMSRLHEIGYIEEKTSRGIHYYLDESHGTGTLDFWGDSKTLAYLDLDVCYTETQYVLNYSDVVGVQITLLEENEMEYYKSSDNIQRLHYGTFCYVNHVCIPWVKKYPKGDRIKALTIMLCDEFLRANGIHLSSNDWNDFARDINSRSLSIPSISVILKQIKHSDISDEYFNEYLRIKALEAFIILYDYSKKIPDVKRMRNKTQTAVKNTIDILNRNFVTPPIITELAKQIGIDKKTLQTAFKEVVGLSIHKYIRTLRMQQSLVLLKENNLSIERIANAVGYQSKIHFYNAFHETFGMKPTQMCELLKK